MASIVHKNVLVPSVPDAVAMCRAVQERFLNLLEMHLQVKGTQLLPPKSLDRAMVLWRTMALRFKSRDFRNSIEELDALREIAQWTLDENCDLRNQPRIELVWTLS